MQLVAHGKAGSARPAGVWGCTTNHASGSGPQRREPHVARAAEFPSGRNYSQSCSRARNATRLTPRNGARRRRREPRSSNRRRRDEWITPSRRRASVAAAAGRDTSMTPSCESRRASIRLSYFPGRSAETFLAEVDNYDASGLPVRRPNSMNNYGPHRERDWDAAKPSRSSSK